MAVYKFRVTFEDYDDVSRDIEIKAGQTFSHLHEAITQSIGFDMKHPASFFLSDEHWKKGQEFSSELKEKSESGVLPMKSSKLTNFINDPHQKLNFTIKGDTTWDFFVELFKIGLEESALEYPRCVKSVGTAPKQYGSTTLGKEKKDLDFLQEVTYMENEEFSSDADEPGEGRVTSDAPEGESEPGMEDLENAGDVSFDEESTPENDLE